MVRYITTQIHNVEQCGLRVLGIWKQLRDKWEQNTKE